MKKNYPIIDSELVTDLIARMKELYRADIGNGITATDVRHMLTHWLADNHHLHEAERLQNQMIKFLDSKAFKKLEEDTRNDQLDTINHIPKS